MTDTSQPPSPFASLVPQRSVGLKLLLVCGLALLMAIPAAFLFAILKNRVEAARGSLEQCATRQLAHLTLEPRS